jgi:hypothetical protein
MLERKSGTISDQHPAVTAATSRAMAEVNVG